MIYNKIELAWAAGFFDGEGSVYTTKQPQILACVYQNTPEPLERFREVVGFGKIYGPYQTATMPRYYWQVGTFGEAQQTFVLLYPYIGFQKREQFLKCLRKYWK